MALIGRFLFILAVALAPAAAAAQPAKTQNARPATVQVPTLDEDGIEAWSEKLDRYASVLTDTIRAWPNVLRYMSSFNFRTGPTGKEDSVYHLYELDPERFAAAVARARELAREAPAMPELDRAAEAFAQAIEGMPAVFNEAAAYYGSGEEYRFDRLEKGKALHPRIMAAIEPYLATLPPFLFRAGQTRRALNGQELAMLERRDGKALRWHMRRLHEAGLDAAVHIPTGPRGSFNTAGFEAALKTYAEAVAAFRAWRQSPAGQDDVAAVSRFDLDAPESFLRKLREFPQAYRLRERVNVQWELLVLGAMSDYHDFWAATLKPIQHLRETRRSVVAMKSMPAAKIDVPRLAPDRLEAWREKISRYLRVLTETNSGIDAWHRYRDWVDLKRGPTGRERSVGGLAEIDRGRFAAALAGARRLAATEPRIEALDRLALAYADAAEGIVEIVNEANAYYQRRDHTTDKLAAGKALHPKLMAAFEPFLAARGALSETVQNVRASLDAQWIAVIEARDGRTRDWHRERILLLGREVNDSIAGSASRDLAAFDAALARFAEAVKDLDDDAAHREVQGGELASRARAYLGAVRDYRGKLGQPGRHPSLIDGERSSLGLQYSIMVGVAER